MNPRAIVFWAFLALIGYLIGNFTVPAASATGALIGLTVGLGISLWAEYT